MNEQSETRNFRGDHIEENNRHTRILGIVLISFCHFFVIVFVGCGAYSLPSVNEISTSNTLPIDGIWKPLGESSRPWGGGVNGNSIRSIGIIFKVDGGRMYIYAGSAEVYTTIPRGAVVIKDIKPANELRKYTAVCATISDAFFLQPLLMLGLLVRSKSKEIPLLPHASLILPTRELSQD